MIVVVLSVTPERLRGSLTRWLLEVDTGVYVGHLSARVREQLWLRIREDVGRGRALMVWSTSGEQRLDYRAHNHSWTPEDLDGITLMRRPERGAARVQAPTSAAGDSEPGRRSSPSESDEPSTMKTSSPQRSWSNAGRRRRYRNAVERRLQSGPPSDSE